LPPSSFPSQCKHPHGLAEAVVVPNAEHAFSGNLRTGRAESELPFGLRNEEIVKRSRPALPLARNAFTNGQLIDTAQNRATRTRTTPIFALNQSGTKEQSGLWRTVRAYSRKRAVHDQESATAPQYRARKVIEGQEAARTPRIVKTMGGKHRLDEASLARARQLAGLKRVCLNGAGSLMTASEIIGSYHRLWHAQQSSA
jgi:hypothetical protein